MNATSREFIFEAELTERLDKFLASQTDTLSRIQIQALIEAGKVMVDNAIVRKPAYKLKNGQRVFIELPEQTDKFLSAERIALEVLYQDENTVVINKPAGMIVHPGAGHMTGTVVNAALSYWPEMRGVGEPERPGVVHRLDKETSGVLILARTQQAYLWFVKQFKSRKTEKIYLALVDGQPPTPSGRIEAAIWRDPNHRQRMAIAYEGQGRRATSEYHTIQNFANHTVLEVHPLTGRTHQIRVHLAYLGCPVVGDRIYGRKKPSLSINRFFLHASKLRITLPGDEKLTEFYAPLPADLAAILSTLQKVE